MVGTCTLTDYRSLWMETLKRHLLLRLKQVATAFLNLRILFYITYLSVITSQLIVNLPTNSNCANETCAT